MTKVLLYKKIFDNFRRIWFPNLEDLISKIKSLLLNDKYFGKLLKAFELIYLLPSEIFFKDLLYLNDDNILSVPFYFFSAY